jgi:hypothetical protein
MADIKLFTITNFRERVSLNKMRLIATFVFIGVFIFLSFTLTSCFSVKYSTTGASISPELKTLSVQMFSNRSDLAPPTIVQTLTDKLRDKCRDNTSLIIVTEGGDADFEGEVTGYDTRPQVIQANDNAASERITITVKVKFTNSAEPKMSFDQSFSRYRDYTSPADLEAKLPEIYDDLIEDIFNKAFVNW